MKYTEEQVLKILDSCFHMYASDYRTDAKDCAIEIMKGMKNTEQEINLNIPIVVGQSEQLNCLTCIDMGNLTGSQECNNCTNYDKRRAI